MRGGLRKERAGGAAPVGVWERTRCSRRQSPPSSTRRAGGTQLVVEGGGEGEPETGESRGPRGREGARIHSRYSRLLTHVAHPSRCWLPRAALVSGGARTGEEIRAAVGGGVVGYRGGAQSPTSQDARPASHDQCVHSNHTPPAHHHPI